MEWISVNDRLPPDDEQRFYLVYLKDGNYEIAFWYAWEQEEADWLDITHWMPLPDPPERAK